MTSYQKFTNLNDRLANRKDTFSPEISKNQTNSYRSSKYSELNGLTLNKARKNRKEVETDV